MTITDQPTSAPPKQSARISSCQESDLDEIVDFQMLVNGLRYPKSHRRAVHELFTTRLAVADSGLGWLARNSNGELVAMALGCWTNHDAESIGDLTDTSVSATLEIYEPDGQNLYVLNLAVDRLRAQHTSAPLNIGRRLLTLLYATALNRGCRTGLGHSRIPSLREVVAADDDVSPMLRLWAKTLDPGTPVNYSALTDPERAHLDQIANELAGLAETGRSLDPTVRYYGMLGGSKPVRVLSGAAPLDHDCLGFSVLQSGRPDRVRTLVSMRL